MEQKKKLGAVTLGCRVNQYETQACCEIFESFGYETSEPSEDCDAFFLNTCSVTLESDRKSRQMISRLVKFARPSGAPVVVCGCHVQAHPDEVFDYDRIYLCGNADKSAFVRSFLEGECAGVSVPSRKEMDRFYPAGVSFSKNTRAFVKIEDGCDNFCSYCIVARLRGPVRSRPADEVEADVRRLAANGYREIVLTGIETSFYGRDPGGEDLVSLSERVSRIEGVERIRFGSLRPTLFTRDFSRRLSGVEKVMPHFHLSVQSGSDRILSLMRRGYGRDDVLRAFENVREFFADAAFSADVICGFPGETEEDFLLSASLVE
ncbi:MAG: MiaB/RimO family radical SAM methylthiotransferase, partial [Clostridia bacterium]|nr:MiaB/RimO family radical SAM methylthiotransferase [Clostridia bacterium]